MEGSEGKGQRERVRGEESEGKDQRGKGQEEMIIAGQRYKLAEFT